MAWISRNEVVMAVSRSHQGVPQDRFAVHQGPGLVVVTGRAAFDQVGRQRERGSGEADQRGGPELADQGRDGLGDVGDVTRLQRAQLLQVRGAPHRAVQDRADTGLDVDADAHRLQRDHDVAEQDGRVDRVAAHRLQGDLGDQVRPGTRLQHGDARPDRPVLRQRAAGHAACTRPGCTAPAPGGRRAGTANPWRAHLGSYPSRITDTPRNLPRIVVHPCQYQSQPP